MYQEELQMYLDRKKHLNDNRIKVYSLIISNYCTKQMKTRVEEHPKFETEIIDDPIALLENIKILTNMYLVAKHQRPQVLICSNTTKRKTNWIRKCLRTSIHSLPKAYLPQSVAGQT